MTHKDASSVATGIPSVPPDRGAPEEQPRWRRDFPIDWVEDDQADGVIGEIYAEWKAANPQRSKTTTFPAAIW